jgi:hypothetical protein
MKSRKSMIIQTLTLASATLVLIPSASRAEDSALYYCETGDPSGTGAHADVELKESGTNAVAKISWYSARRKQSEHTLPRASVRTVNDPSNGAMRISTFIVSNAVRFEFVEFALSPKTPALSLYTFGRSVHLSCQK